MSLEQGRFIFLLWPALYLPCYLAAAASLASPGHRPVAAALSALALSLVLRRFLLAQAGGRRLSEFQRLLAFLASRLGAGSTLERALGEAENGLKTELGPKNRLILCLADLRQQLAAQMNLNHALLLFVERFGLARAATELSLLPVLDRYGGRSDVFLRRSHDALSRELAMYRDVKSERSQTSTEAVVLSILPFGLAATLGQSPPSAAWEPLAQLLIFALAMLAVVLVVVFLAPEQKKKPRPQKTEKQKTGARPARLLRRLYLQGLPADLGYRLQRMTESLDPDSPEPFARYLQKKRLFLLAGLLLALLILLAGWLPFYLLPALALVPALLQDFDLFARETARGESYRLLWPVVLNLIVVLLESGLTLEKSLSLLPFRDLEDVPGSAGWNLLTMRRQLLVGGSIVDALTEQAERCPLPDLRAAIHLLLRYDREGGQELLEILSLTADQSWQLYRQAVRRRLERRELYLLLPMALDLVSVIATAMLPAIASFGAI